MTVPMTNSGVPNRILRNRVEMNTPNQQELYKEAQAREEDRKLILGGIFDVQIMMNPVKRLIRAVDSIGVSPIYITTIYFPENMKIINIQASFSTQILEYHQNMMRFRPNDDFYTGNMIITMTDGNKNYAMTIFVNRYFQKDCFVKKNSYICRKITGIFKDSKATKKYKYSYDNLASVFIYKNPIKVAPLVAMGLYEKLKGRLHIARENDYVEFIYKGISYKIIKDSKFGTVFYRGSKYRVTASK